MSDSFLPHEMQHTRLPCSSLSPRVCWKSCSLSQWGHPTILSSVTPFSSYPQSFPASGPFPVSWLFASGGQSIGASASASVLPMNIQGWFTLGLTGLISLLSKELSRVLSSTSLKTSILQHSAFYMVQFSHPYMTTGKARALTMHTFVSKVMTLLFNASSRFFQASFSSKEQASFNFYSWVSWNDCQSHIHGGVIKGPLFIPQLGLWGIGKLSKSGSYSIVSGPRLTPCQPHSIPAKWMPFFLLNSVPNLSFIQMPWIGGAQIIPGAMAARKPEKWFCRPFVTWSPREGGGNRS